MSEKAPKVLVLKAITPSVESVRAEELRYGNLPDAVEKYRVHDRERQETFWNAETDTLEESQAAQQLALQYMLMTAIRASNPTESDETKQLWADRYTRASSEIYGSPEQDAAFNLLSDQAAQLLDDAKDTTDDSLLSHYRSQLDRFGVSHETQKSVEHEYHQEALAIREVLTTRFNDVFEALEVDMGDRPVEPAEVADRFEAALAVLAVHDTAWSEWSVERNPDKDSLSVEAGKKKILVGQRRASVRPQQLKGLFAHEVLLHAQRAVNGAKLSDELRTGLPGYLDAEEGIGVFFEYAITGKVPEKNVDRYIDVALAMGQINGEPVNRKDLIDFALTRAHIRNELASDSEKQSDEDVAKSVYAHVNRIYRGSLGDEHVGVFTKDHIYHKGFLDIGKYVSQAMAEGASADEVYDYLVMGKFDPMNELHVAELKKIQAKSEES